MPEKPAGSTSQNKPGKGKATEKEGKTTQESVTKKGEHEATDFKKKYNDMISNLYKKAGALEEDQRNLVKNLIAEAKGQSNSDTPKGNKVKFAKNVKKRRKTPKADKDAVGKTEAEPEKSDKPKASTGAKNKRKRRNVSNAGGQKKKAKGSEPEVKVDAEALNTWNHV